MRFVGEPVAVVVADTRAHAVDAAELVVVESQSLPVVVDTVAGLEPGAPLLFPEFGSNETTGRPPRHAVHVGRPPRSSCVPASTTTASRR